MKSLLKTSIFLAFQLLIVRPALYVYFGVRYRRRSNLPKGPCLVVSNHNSHVDAAALMTLFPLRRLPHVHPVAAADYFGKTWFKRNFAMLLMNGIPIERTPQGGLDPLSPLAAALEAGKSLVFFPEGSRGEAGVVGPFRPGVGRLARQVPGLLIVPVYLSGPERMWPRGQAVPVPLGLDVNVGRPRSYSPVLDAKEIAEEVRRDVLALAPAPPPVPGPRPDPPLRVAVCGIDPSVLRRVFVDLTERLGRTDRTVGVSEPVIEADARGVRESARGIPVARSRTWPAVLAWGFRTGGLFKGSKFAEMVNRARLEEALMSGRSARFVVEEGNALVDLLAWAEADFYSGTFDEKGLQHVMLYLAGERRIPFRQWWRFVRRAPEVWLLNVFDLARLRPPDVLVHIATPSAVAMERLRSRGEAIAPWQNERFLGELERAYAGAAQVLRRRGRVELLEVEEPLVAPAEIAERAEVACFRVLLEAGKLTASP